MNTFMTTLFNTLEQEIRCIKDNETSFMQRLFSHASKSKLLKVTFSYNAIHVIYLTPNNQQLHDQTSVDEYLKWKDFITVS